MDEQALLDEFDDLMTFLEDDLGRPLTEDETSEIIEYVFDDDEDEGDEPTIENVENAFCATGEGGGVDPSCGSSSSGSADTYYPTAGKVVDGREVLDNIDNQDSIDASIEGEYETLPGVREVQMSDFPGLSGKSYSVSETQRIKDLAAKIKHSNKISPLIVVDDGHPDGPYILEGGHRGEALKLLGAKSFPAMVVLDTDSINGQKGRPSRLGGAPSNEGQ